MSWSRSRIYLAYGSNLHPRRLEARVGRVRLLGTAILPGWSLRFDKRGGDGSTKANLRPAPGTASEVHAAAYALTVAQLRMLDNFEGCGRGYETLALDIAVESRRVEALAYLAPSQWLSGSLSPFDWYVDLIVGGARFHGMGESYVRRIAAHSVCRDPDCGRARRELEGLGLPIPDHYKA